MEKDQKQTTQQNDAVKNNSAEQGRQPGNTQQTATESNTDISQVDQQEGEMNHGELGGNLTSNGSTQGA